MFLKGYRDGRVPIVSFGPSYGACGCLLIFVVMTFAFMVSASLALYSSPYLFWGSIIVQTFNVILVLCGMLKDPGIPLQIYDLYNKMRFNRHLVSDDEYQTFRNLQKNKDWDNFQNCRITETDPETSIVTRYYFCQKCQIKEI